jgi:clan AA aspartic protease (TIGR02281 family)
MRRWLVVLAGLITTGKDPVHAAAAVALPTVSASLRRPVYVRHALGRTELPQESALDVIRRSAPAEKPSVPLALARPRRETRQKAAPGRPPAAKPQRPSKSEPAREKRATAKGAPRSRSPSQSTKTAQTSPAATPTPSPARQPVTRTSRRLAAVQPWGETYGGVGGVTDAVRQLWERVEIPYRNPAQARRLGVTPPRGVLLHGPTGTGKTTLARALAHQLDAEFIEIGATDVIAKWDGESEGLLRGVFNRAVQAAQNPAKIVVLTINELDAIAGKRTQGSHYDSRLSTQLLTAIEQLPPNVIVVGTTNRLNVLDPAMRRPGRFNLDIAVPAPDEAGRRQILGIHTNGVALAKDVDLAQVAERTRGYTGADLKEVVSVAGGRALLRAHERDSRPQAQRAVRSSEARLTKLLESDAATVQGLYRAYEGLTRSGQAAGGLSYEQFLGLLVKHLPGWKVAAQKKLGWQLELEGARFKVVAVKGQAELQIDPPLAHGRAGAISLESRERSRVTHADFVAALAEVRPSLMKEYAVDAPPVLWNDIAGLDDVKRRLRQAVELPLKNPEGVARLKVRPPRGVMLFGPQGTGKTMLAQALATEVGASFISVKGSDLRSKWYSESAEKMAELLQRAREAAPVVLFIDEINGVLPARDQMGPGELPETAWSVEEFLTSMDGISKLKGVVIVGATNRPDAVDGAALRRFDEWIYLPPPDQAARLAAFETHNRQRPLARDVNLRKLAERTVGYTPADIERISEKAALRALGEDPDADVVKARHFEEALRETQPSVSTHDLAAYEAIARRFDPGAGGANSAAPAARAVLRFHPTHGGMEAEATFAGTTNGRFLIDTGASLVTVSQQFAQRLGLVGSRPTRIDTAMGPRSGRMAHVDRITLQGLEARDLDVVILDAPAGLDGVLGMNFIRQFNLQMTEEGAELTAR